MLNAGTAGGGGTGNLPEQQPIGVAMLAYALEPRFDPLAADLVEIDPGSGDVTASRKRLDGVGDASAGALLPPDFR